MFEQRLRSIFLLLCHIDILMDFSTQSSSQNLYAATNAQNRYLAVVGFLQKLEFLLIPFCVDAMQLRNRLFTQQQRIEVSTSAEKNTIYPIQVIVQQLFGGFVHPERRNNHRSTSSPHDRLVVGVCQQTVGAIKITRNSDYGTFVLFFHHLYVLLSESLISGSSEYFHQSFEF